MGSPVLPALSPLLGATAKWNPHIPKPLQKDTAAITTASHPTPNSCDLSTNTHQPESGPDSKQPLANCTPTSAVGGA